VPIQDDFQNYLENPEEYKNNFLLAMSKALKVPIDKINIVSIHKGSVWIKITVEELCEGINDKHEKEGKLLKYKKDIKDYVK
jgi:hypothetical protein